MMQRLPIVKIADPFIRLAEIAMDSKIAVLEMDFKEDKGEPDEKFQPVAVGDVLPYRLVPCIDDLAEPNILVTAYPSASSSPAKSSPVGLLQNFSRHGVGWCSPTDMGGQHFR